MKVDEKIREKLIQAFQITKNNISCIMDRYYEVLRNAETVEELMEAKRVMLKAFMKEMPLTRDDCYFCIFKREYNIHDCEKCEYAKYHGACCWEESDWKRIVKSHNELRYAIDNYYKGEKYEKIFDMKEKEG